MKRLLSLMMALCLCFGLISEEAFASEDSSKNSAVMFGTDAVLGYDNEEGYHYIYFGEWQNNGEAQKNPIKWRVLDNKTNTWEQGLFVLSEVLLGTGKDGGVYFDKSFLSDTYQGSDAQAWCKDFEGSEGDSVPDAFTTTELNAIIATTKSDESYVNHSSMSFKKSDYILNGDKVFFLSAEEADEETYGFCVPNDIIANYGDNPDEWLLRSPHEGGESNRGPGMVTPFGSAYYYQFGYHNFACAARPAFNLDISAVLFTSAADNSGHNGFSSPAEYDGKEWKLTLKDENSFAEGTSASGTELTRGEELTITHSSLESFGADYTNVTAVLADGEGNILYYGSINDDVSAVSSVITVPEDAAFGSYTIYIYGEQWNAEGITDYATGIPFTIEVSIAERRSEGEQEDDVQGDDLRYKDTVTIEVGGEKTESESKDEENPNTGAPVIAGAVVLAVVSIAGAAAKKK